MSGFFQNLQRRNVIKAAISYVVIAWAILQAADIIFPAIGISDIAIRNLLILLVIGFPVWIIFAYVYEWTPTGFRKTKSIPEEVSVHRETSKRLNSFIIIGMGLAIVLLVADRFLNFTDITSDDPSKAIAVLPFKNLSGDEDAYFAQGVTEDILTHISKIGDLRVLSRFTLSDYDVAGKTVEQIGEELNVGYLLTGSIRRAGEELRISCQLVQVNPEEETWAENFDRRMEDVFAIQSEVAGKVADYLAAKLSSSELERINQIPTTNIASYNIYLKGREAYNRYNVEDNKVAIEYFKKAIELDPAFGDAWAGLSDATAKAAANYGSLPISYLDSALLLAEKAVNLNPLSAAAWKAWGVNYSYQGLYDRAREKYEKALELDPNHSPAINNLAMTKLSKGDYPGAIKLFKKLISLNPVNPNAYSNIANRYLTLGMHDLAEKNSLAAIEMAGSDWHAYSVLAKNYLWIDDRDKCEEFARLFVQEGPENPYYLELAAFIIRDVNPELSNEYFEKAWNAPNYNATYYLYTTMWKIQRFNESGEKLVARELMTELQDHIDVEIKKGARYVELFLVPAYIKIEQGFPDEALDWIEELVKNNQYYDIPIKSDPWLKEVSSHPRFLAAMKKMEESKRNMRMEVSAQTENKSL